MRLFVRQRYQVSSTSTPLAPCRTVPKAAASPPPFDPSSIWLLRLDPLSKLLLLAYAALADGRGRVLQPEPGVLATQTGMRMSSVRSLTRTLLERGLLTVLTEDDTETQVWGFLVSVEGRVEA